MIIKPAAEENNYDVIRADQIQEPGTIASQVIQYCVEAELLFLSIAITPNQAESGAG